VFDGHGGSRTSQCCADNWATLVSAGFTEADNKDVEKILRQSVESLYQIVKREKVKDGTTLVSCLVIDTTVWTVNLGDSRAVAFDGERRLLALSVDQKPTSYSEFLRLQESRDVVVNGRVNSVIAVSRSLGDFACNLSHEPDITKNSLEGMKLLVIACDGVWDVFSSSSFCARVLKDYREDISLQYLACRAVNYAFSLGSRDNISVCLVRLQ